MKHPGVLIVENDARARGQLVRAVEQTLAKCDVIATASLEKGRELLETFDSVSVIFVPGALSNLELAQFVEAAKATPSAKSAVVVGVAAPEQMSEKAVAEQMIIGLHSFLFAPYSANSIEQALRLGARVRRNGSASRLKAAAAILLKEHMEREGLLQDSSAHTESLWESVRATYDQFREMTGESLSAPVVHALEKMPPRERAERCESISKFRRKLVRKANTDDLMQ